MFSLDIIKFYQHFKSQNLKLYQPFRVELFAKTDVFKHAPECVSACANTKSGQGIYRCVLDCESLAVSLDKCVKAGNICRVRLHADSGLIREYLAV